MMTAAWRSAVSGCCVLSLAARAAAQVSVQGFVGTAFSLPTPLRIAQRGSDPIRLTARYHTKPLRGAPYYAWRVERETGERRGYALDFVHHKLYLQNRPPDVQKFEISHGFNMLSVAPWWRRGAARYLAGVGVVITHPETTVRGKALPAGRGLFGGGYYISGVTLQGALGRRFRLGDRLFTSLEGKLTASYARVPVAEGTATVPNIALHTLVGVGSVIGDLRDP